MDDNVRHLISKGSAIAGSTAGAAIVALTGGLEGVAFGTIVGSLTQDILGEFANRWLSDREQTRVGATAAFAVEKITADLASGRHLRDDGFFSSSGTIRSNAEEIFEGVLLKSKNEHEEKKTRILGNIFANIAFTTGFSVEEGNHLLQVADNLTYRQMCLLSLAERNQLLDRLKLRDAPYGIDGRDMPSEIVSVRQEVFDLVVRGLVSCGTSWGGDYPMLMNPNLQNPDAIAFTDLGKRYCEIMGLEDIPVEDVLELVKSISE